MIPYLGQILAVLTAIVWAAAVILFKKSGEQMHPISLNLFKNTLAVLLILITMPFMGETIFRHVPIEDYILLFISGILGLGIADTFMLKGLNLVGAGLSAIVACLYSPFIIALSIIFLGERLAFLQIIGAAMIIMAVLTAVGKNGHLKHNISRRNLWLGILYGALANIATAVGIIIIKPLLARSPLLWATEMRLFSGIAVLVLATLFHRDRNKIALPKMNFRGWIFTISGSFAGAYLSLILWLAAMKITLASIAAALNQTSTIFIFLFAYLFLREQLNTRKIIGLALGMTGTILVIFG
jgi:drug/metabolite transporter (DMT)-like permease